MKLNSVELWSGLAALALSVAVVWSGYSLDLGTINDPGSGYVLFYVGFLMMLFSAVMLYSAIKDQNTTRSFASLWRDVSWSRPLIAIALLLVFAVVFETLGFLLSTITLLLALLRLIDPVPWRRAVPIAVLVPLAFWYVLQKLLLIALPAGLLGIG